MARQIASADDRAVTGADLEHELRRRLANEDRLTRLATTFVTTPVDGFDVGVRAALAEIGSLEGVDRVNVWLRRGDLMHHCHEWTGPGIAATIEIDGAYPLGGGPFLDALRTEGEVHIVDVELLPDEWSEERASLLERDVRCLLAVAMLEDGELLGQISFSSLSRAPIFSAEHVSTLRAASGILAQAFARQRVEERLAFEARFDSVTGLGNRWSFHEAVDGALARLAEGATPGLAVLLLDLDRFKVVNDSLGHGAGDQLLAEVGARLSAELGPAEHIARFGGDEIVVLVEGCESLVEASDRAEALRKALIDPFVIDGRRIAATASIGVAFVDLDDEDARHTNELLRRADSAMYLAKERGRDRVERYDATTPADGRVRLDDEIDLQTGVAEQQFVLHYQPEIALSTGAIVAVEALVRWQHPERGLLGPDRFIPLAEETGLILRLGTWVIEEACRQLAEWNRLGVRPVLRINLSARQLNEPDLASSVLDSITRAGVDPGDVCLEITETALMADAELSLAILERLRHQGLRLAIDDFGTGYSSLAYLKRFPVDVIKVDRSFVAGLGTDPDDTAIVRTIISMADALRLGVTAEGVETDEQRAALTALGCDRAQGFLFARPEPADATTARLLGS